MNSSSSDSHSNFINFENEYKNNLFRIVLYYGIRILQMIVGITGNALTLHIIRNLKVLKNVHIFMIYVAITDIVVNCVVPLAIFTDVTGIMKNRPGYWETLCLCKDGIYFAASGFSFVCHFNLSVDRYV